MEISPIPGIRSLPVMKTPPADSNVSRVFDVENSPKPDDDTYSGGSRKGAGGQDDDNEEDTLMEEAEAAPSAESTERGTVERGSGVNFFA